MKVKDIRELTASELETKIKDTHEELANLRFQHALHQLDDAVKVRRIRQDLARMLTIHHENQAGIAEARVGKTPAREK